MPMFLMLLVPVVISAIAIFFLVFWIKMIIHAAKHNVENKTVWIIVMVFFGVLGGIAYYFAVKRGFKPMAETQATTIPPVVSTPSPTSVPPSQM